MALVLVLLLKSEKNRSNIFSEEVSIGHSYIVTLSCPFLNVFFSMDTTVPLKQRSCSTLQIKLLP